MIIILLMEKYTNIDKSVSDQRKDQRKDQKNNQIDVFNDSADSNTNANNINKDVNNKNLPFVERFRPKTLDGIMSHTETIKILKKCIKSQDIPHLLFYGPPGTGKTSTIEAFVNELYGDDYVYMTMNINASEERGIEIVRNKIKNFVSTAPLFNGKVGAPKYKFVILDEADAMTFDAQGMLKQVIEYYTNNARFCLICNCNKKINPAIQSRCTIFNFPPLDYNSVKKKINIISKEFDLNITNDGINTLWKLSNGDMRKVLHTLQVISINNKVIDSDKITTFKNYPTNKEMDDLYNVLIQGKLDRSINHIENLNNQKHYALIDIVTEMSHRLNNSIINNNINPDRGANLITRLRDIEINIISTSDTVIQLANIACVFSY